MLLQSSLRASEADKRRMMDRIVKLEDELRVLRLTNGLVHTPTHTYNDLLFHIWATYKMKFSVSYMKNNVED